MTEESKPRSIFAMVLAFILWLITFVLGLEGINTLKNIYIFILARSGQTVQQAELSAPMLVFVVGFAFMVFVIWSTEYHVRRVGQSASWRLFGWTIAVELGIEVIYYLL